MTIGTMTTDDAKDPIDLSLGILEQRPAEMALQETRSKASLKSSR